MAYQLLCNANPEEAVLPQSKNSNLYSSFQSPIQMSVTLMRFGCNVKEMQKEKENHKEIS
jgi:hypothetical protein